MHNIEVAKERKRDPAIGEVVQCEREPRNAVDRYSVAVTERSCCWTFAMKGYPDCSHSPL